MARRAMVVLAVGVLLVTVVLGSTAALAGDTAQSYIVVLRPGTQDVPGVAAALAGAHGGRVGFVYEDALRGFSMTMSPRAAAALARNPMVAYVEADAAVSIAAQTIPTGIQRIFADDNPNLYIDGVDDYRVDVDVAVIDTGVDFQHPDLNVAGGVNCTGSIFLAKCVAGGDDDHYHGTHVAGSIAALDNGVGVVGVAPGARIWAVKVLNSKGSGYTSWIVAGINWVAANASTIEVANMSLGGSGYSQAEYDAIQGAVNKGVVFAVAAGNSDDNADDYSPSAFSNVLTVSALADFDGLAGGLGSPTCRTDQDDTLADFSNWGPEVDVAAPGVCILSTYPIEKGTYGTISGTSMASPHAAGALALLASASNPSNATDVYNLYNQVKNAGNYTWTDDSGDGIQEPLLDVSNTVTFAPVLVEVATPPPTTTTTTTTTTTSTTSTTLPGGDISLSSVVTYEVRRVHYADLRWSGGGEMVDVWRNTTRVATTANDGSYTDNTRSKTISSATYKVCNAGTTVCSSSVSVTWP